MKSRRKFIRGMGLGAGTVLLTPMLDGILNDALAQVPTGKRLITWAVPHGIAADDLTEQVLSGLGDVRPFATVYRNLNCTQYRFKHGSHWSAFTGMRPLGVNGNPENTAGAWGSGPAGPTMDYILAEALGQDTHPRLMALGEQTGSASGPNQPYGGPSTAQAALSQYFQGLDMTPMMQEASGPSEAVRRRRHVLDFLTADVTRARGRLAGEERAKLDQYLTALEQIETGLSIGRPALECTRPSVTGGATYANYAQLATIAAHAAGCGISRHVTISFPGNDGVRIPELGFTEGQHNIHHSARGEMSNESSLSTPAAKQAVLNFHRFHLEQMANVFRILQQYPEGSGTKADSTILVYHAQTGRHHKGFYDQGFVTVGGGGGALAPLGEELDFGGDELVHGFWLTIAHAMGHPMRSFGEASAPLPGVLV